MRKKQQKPKVSVIIPVYNVEKYLPECLDSVINQTLPDIEIICVDDGSTDRSLAILSKYAKQDNRIKIIKQQNKFAGAARNAGLDAAQGEFLSFLDSDDFFEPEMLEEMYNKAKDEESDMVVCGYYTYDQMCERNTFQRKLNPQMVLDAPIKPEEYSDKLFNFCFPTPWTKLIKHDLFTKYNLRFENLKKCNDLTCIYLTIATAQKISFVNKPFVHYRSNTGTQTSSDRFGKNEYFIQAASALEKNLQRLGLYDKFYEKMFYTLASSLRWETKDDIRLLRDLAKQHLSERLYHDLYETKRFKDMKDDMLAKRSQTYKLLFFLPLGGWKEKGGKKVWNILGIPMLKRRKIAKDGSIKYYLFGFLPIIKISPKTELPQI